MPALRQAAATETFRESRGRGVARAAPTFGRSPDGRRCQPGTAPTRVARDRDRRTKGCRQDHAHRIDIRTLPERRDRAISFLKLKDAPGIRTFLSPIPRDLAERRAEDRAHDIDRRALLPSGDPRDRRSPVDMLFADRGGEDYRGSTDDPSTASGFAEIIRADTITFLVDGHQLVDLTTRNSIASEIVGIVQALIDGDALAGRPRAAVVLTKVDEIGRSADRDRDSARFSGADIEDSRSGSARHSVRSGILRSPPVRRTRPYR